MSEDQVGKSNISIFIFRRTQYFTEDVCFIINNPDDDTIYFLLFCFSHSIYRWNILMQIGDRIIHVPELQIY